MEILAIFVLFVLLIIYIRKTNQLLEKILKLEAELYGLRNAVHSLKPASSPAMPPEPKIESPDQPARPLSPPQSRPVMAVPPSRTRGEWEALIGGKLLNRIGAFALILGVGFFLKYAFDNDLIPEPLRVLIGFFFGAGLLLGGGRWHKKGLAVFAQGLIGAGIAILYLAVYASFNYYHLVSQPVAFVLMSAVTALTFFQALKYDSLAVSLLGWAGGSLTPIMLSTGQANEVGLFTYLALLDLGVLAILLKKEAWIILEPLTLAATYLIYFAWNDKYYVDSDLLLTIFFLTAFWGLFYGLDVLRLIKGTTAFQKIRQGVAGLNALFYYLALYNLIDPLHSQWVSGVTLLLGSIYFLTFLALKQRQPDAAPALARFVLIAIALLVIATAIQFSGFITATFWSLEALILVWCGMNWNMPHVWRAGLGLIGLALLKLFVTDGAFSYFPLENFKLIFNQRALAFTALAAASGIGAIFLRRVNEKSVDLFKLILHGTWATLLFILLTVESDDYFRRQMFEATGETAASLKFNRLMAWAAIWALYSLPLVWLGMRYRILSLLWGGFGSLACAIFTIAIRGVALNPISHFTFILNWRAAVFILVIAGIVIHARWLQANRQSYPWISEVLGILQVAVVLLLLELFTSETRDIFKKAIFQAEGASDSNASHRLQNLQQLTLSAVWLFYSVLLMVTGIWRRVQGLRLIAIVLFGITILKIFIYDLSFLERLYRIFSFIGLGVILLAVSYLYQRYKEMIFASTK